MGRRVKRAAVAAAAAVFLGGAATAQGSGPARIASINLCTDQLLLDLADRGQILGLSPFARDLARSWAATAAADLPLLSGTAEEIMMQQPTLVLAGSFTKRATQDFIRARGIPLEAFGTVRTVGEAKEQIRRVAQLVGAEARGEARAAALDAALLRLKAAATARQLSVLPVSRRGWTAGRDSILSDLLVAAGLTNAGAEQGSGAGRFLSLEAIVSLRPDAILITAEDARAEDQGQALLLHPAMQALFPAERRIVIPESATVCGGPMLTHAMDRLADQITRLRPRDIPAR